MHELDFWMGLTIAGLTAISVITRGFFYMSEREWRLPGWAQRGLAYAPIAAIAAVISPDILLIDGHLTAPWRDARVWGALAGGLYYVWRRHDALAMPLAIGAGMAVFLPLRLLLNW